MPDVAVRYELIVPPDGDTTLRGHLFETEAEARRWCAQPCAAPRGYSWRAVEVPRCPCCRLYHLPERCDADAPF